MNWSTMWKSTYAQTSFCLQVPDFFLLQARVMWNELNQWIVKHGTSKQEWKGIIQEFFSFTSQKKKKIISKQSILLIFSQEMRSKHLPTFPVCLLGRSTLDSTVCTRIVLDLTSFIYWTRWRITIKRIFLSSQILRIHYFCRH